MSVKVTPRPDNTRFITMIDPAGNRCPIPLSDRHGARDGRAPAVIEYYRQKGFRTVEEVERAAELERLRQENERLKAQGGAGEASAEAKAAKGKGK